MSLPRAFLSFDFDNDSDVKVMFAGQAKKDSPTPFAVEDWSSKTALPQAEWEKLIKSKINNCHMLIVLVGKNMSTATGVVKEIEMARAQNVPCFGVYVNGAGATSTLPTGLARKSVTAWKWESVANMVDQCANLGKNAGAAGWA
ncbi:hypothetical protein ENKNEFLB_03912 [Nocardioides aquaticus]|uniref:Thoeris protein ThsB TIR-like domain-containing protein n=2 Tax=Actinomycetes TaxID=1760 RepID=A0ABN1TAM6_9ACTN|nr:TIR domain-containing protein [Nocardioides aquaticus]QVT81502.1 hypothetical protein ENKNEFLB_03912 [Nocardioides aquaticus]